MIKKLKLRVNRGGVNLYIKELIFLPITILFLLQTQGCTGTESNEQPMVFKKIPEVQEIKPKNPVKIKIKRNKNGEYSWDISGSNYDEMIKADKRLRDAFKK